MYRCHIALGGNVGDVPAAFRAALSILSGHDLRVAAESSLFSTPPMGAAAGGPFLNAAAVLETSLEPLEVLERLLAVEDALGRVRDRRWGPRVIDLDLVLFGDRVIHSARLTVPHAGSWYRRFVLDPLAEIDPDVVHPLTGESVATLRRRLLPRPLPVGFFAEEGTAESIGASIASEFPIKTPHPGEKPALTFWFGDDTPGFVERVIRVPEGEAGLEAARAVLTAALGEPMVIGGPV
jgi:2-amino-4-hydroxy-6-hydroxymethyldihydropteridine diphosphokinase